MKNNPSNSSEYYSIRYLNLFRLLISFFFFSLIFEKFGKLMGVDYDQDKAPYFTMDLKLGDSLSDIIKKLKEYAPNYSEKYSLESLLNIFIKTILSIYQPLVEIR